MNLKKLLEQRATKQEEMKQLIETANTEERALNAEEQGKFAELEQEIRDIDATIKAIESSRNLEPAPEAEEERELTVEERELQAFDAFLRGQENRADTQLTYSANGAVIPTSIANKIIEKVVEMCPIYHDADRYNMKGTLQIPYYNDESGDIAVEYAEEFTDGTATTGTFASISLTGYLARAIAVVSKSLINNSQFNITDFVVNRMARNIALFIEGELLNGTDSKVEGLKGVTVEVETASELAITADELIDLQESIPDVYQGSAYWIMNKDTRTAIRKLKDGQGNYLLNKDANARWGYTLFGKDVYTSDNMAKLGTKAKTVVYYGDYTGLAVKVSEEVNIEILRETKARQHAVEIVGFLEMDAKVQNAQMIAKMVTKKV